MSLPPLEVVCASCGGRSAIEPEHRSYPSWACPFCAARNAMPAAPAVYTRPVTARRRHVAAWMPIVSTAAVAAIVVAGIAVQRTREPAPYRTVAGVAEALRTKGLGCGSLAMVDRHDPLAREAGRCRVLSAEVTILTFAGKQKRDEYLAAGRRTNLAAGDTWVVVSADPNAAREIALALHGMALPG